MPKVKRKNTLPRKYGVSKVNEATVANVASRKDEPVVSTISSKNQITLPAHLLRDLGLGAGDKVTIRREGKRITVRPRPKDWVAYYGGSMRSVYGDTKEEIDDYLRELRQEDTVKEKTLEEAWAARKSPPE